MTHDNCQCASVVVTMVQLYQSQLLLLWSQLVSPMGPGSVDSVEFRTSDRTDVLQLCSGFSIPASCFRVLTEFFHDKGRVVILDMKL